MIWSRGAHRERKRCMFVSRSSSDDNYIRFFSLSLPPSLSLFLPSREGERKKIECVELFHWSMLKVGRTVCCNQQTNIIISRVHSAHEKSKRREKEKKPYFEVSFFFIASSFRMYSFRCLVDDILICLKWWLYWIIYELASDVLLLFILYQICHKKKRMKEKL
jgi:hypothetical protein